MNILWHDSAVFELEEAALYYGGVDDELGLSFIAEAEVAIAQIKARPQMSRKFDREARKARMKRFPYAVSAGLMMTRSASSPSCTCTVSRVIGMGGLTSAS